MRARAAVAADAAARAALTALAPLAPPADAQNPEREPRADRVLVVEDLRSGRLAAAARLRPAIGLALPRYAYHVGCTVHAARELQLFHRQRTLHLGNDHTGASELCEIAVDREHLALAEQSAALSLVVQAALLCIAEQRGDFAPELIVALPGVHDGAGQSPFWAGLGRHFYAGDPAEAARVHGAGWKSNVAALMPRHPLYSSFLGDAAQAAIAQADPRTQALQEVLAHEGLRYGHHIDIVDGGPILEAAVDDLRSVNASRRWQVMAVSRPLAGSAWRGYAVLNADMLQAARVLGRADGDRLLIAAEDARLLRWVDGQWVRAVPLQA